MAVAKHAVGCLLSTALFDAIGIPVLWFSAGKVVSLRTEVGPEYVAIYDGLARFCEGMVWFLALAVVLKLALVPSLVRRASRVPPPLPADWQSRRVAPPTEE